MLLATSNTTTLLIYIAAPVVAAFVLWVARAIVKLLQNRQTEMRERDSLEVFLFGTERTRSGIPAKEGWTQRVDRILEEILYELKPNGGKNFRGIVEQGVRAAGEEVDKQVVERSRVQRRDQMKDDQS